MDEIWDEARTTATCEEQLRERHRGQHTIELKQGRVDSSYRDSPTAIKGFEEVHYNIDIRVRSYYYYAAVVRCEHDAWFPATADARFELEFTNDGSQFSADEAGMYTCTFLSLVVFSVMSFYASKNVVRHSHSVIEVLIGASVLHGVSMLCQLAHYAAYSSNGYGWSWVPFLTTSLILHEAVKLILTTLFIVISQGWTITTNVLPKRSLLFSIVGVTFLLECFGLVMQGIYAESHDAYSSRAREGSVGLLLVLMQLGLYGWFLKGVTKCISVESKRMSERRGFLMSFAVCCSVWFLTEPLLVIVSTFVANYIRHRLLLGGALLVQTLALCSVSTLFFSRSTFSKISTIGGSLLPSSGHRDRYMHDA